jgi:hypothetical protein
LALGAPLDPIRARGANFLPHRQVDANFILQLHARARSFAPSITCGNGSEAECTAPTLSLQLAPFQLYSGRAFLALSEHHNHMDANKYKTAQLHTN